MGKEQSKVFKALSDLISRVSLANRAGLRFDNARDFYAVFGYLKDLKFSDYLAKYQRQDVAGRIIDAPVQATWRSPPEITSDSQEFKTAWDVVTRKGMLWSLLERVDKLSSLGYYSIGLLGFDDGRDLKTPVSPNTARKLLYIQPYSELSATVKSYETESRNPRFGMPKTYTLDLSSPDLTSLNNSTVRKVEVHYSRVLHVAEGVLQNSYKGEPRLSRVFNLLDDLMKVAGGSAETFWLTANRGLQADIDKDMELDSDDAAALSDAIEEYQHQLRRVIRTRGVKMNSLGSDVPDPTGTFRMLMALISGATGIPQRILLGSEAGQLASEQDRANWAERVSERRSSFAQPRVLEPLIQQLISAGVLPQTDDYEFEWPEAFILSPLESAQTMAQSARAIINLSKRTQFNNPLVSDEEARVIIGLEGPGPNDSDVQGWTEPSEDDSDDPLEDENTGAELQLLPAAAKGQTSKD